MKPEMSEHFISRMPSAIRLAQIEFSKRTDGVNAINVAIGNVSLPMHEAMQKRMKDLYAKGSPFSGGIVKYSATVGEKEANAAFLNIISSSGFDTSRLFSQITNGGSQAMELITLGICGKAGTIERPLLMIDPAYTNYKAMAERLGRSTISVSRHLDHDGVFVRPDIKQIEKVIERRRPGAMVVIPYDNPTGDFYDRKTMIEYAKLCVKHNLWMVSDEAYRELYYVDHATVSIWGIDDSDVPGIEGRRISIETASKVWNACGLRIGALVTDNKIFHEKAVAENTADLCSNVIGQYIIGGLADEPHEKLKSWYGKLREYYHRMMESLTSELRQNMEGIIVSNPDASIYSVVDVRRIAKPGFNALDFVLYCAQKGKVILDGER